MLAPHGSNPPPGLQLTSVKKHAHKKTMRRERPHNDAHGIAWSVSIHDADAGTVLYEHDASRVLETASIGKLALLGYVGAAMRADSRLAAELLGRSSVEPVEDSGIWQHLSVDRLTIADATTLIFATSDNWATNALLRRFGLGEIDRFRSRLGLTDTVLFDQVRNGRGPEHPPALSQSSAAELSAFMASLWRGEVLGDPDFCAWFVGGLSLSLDLSMVGAPIGLDPLAHPGPRTDPGLANKTGTDVGIRGDTGILSVRGHHYAYACIANYGGGIGQDREVIGAMHDVGLGMLRSDCRALPFP